MDARIDVACDIMEEHNVNISTMTKIAMMTSWCLRACSFESLVVYFDVRVYDIWEGMWQQRV